MWGGSGTGGGDPQDLLAAVATSQTKRQEIYNTPRACTPHGAWCMGRMDVSHMAHWHSI